MRPDRQQIVVAISRELRLHDAQSMDLDARAERLTTLFRGLYNIAVADPTPERRAPQWNPKLGEGQFEDPAERLLRHQAYQTYDEWLTLRDKRDTWAAHQIALWDKFERLETAADVLEHARGGGPQPGLVLRADAIQVGDGIVVPETGEVKFVTGTVTDGGLPKASDDGEIGLGAGQTMGLGGPR